MATYLGSKKINTIYDISVSTSLDDFLNGTITSLNQDQLSGIKEVRKEAFYNQTSLSSVVFPNTLKSIGDNAFSGCSSLSYVRFTSPEPPMLGNSALPTGNTFRSIYVPSESLEDYKNASGFSSYVSKIRGW